MENLIVKFDKENMLLIITWELLKSNR